MKTLFVLNSTWNLLNFRSGLIRALESAGHDIVAVASRDNYAPKLKELNCRLIPVQIDAGGMNPGKDLDLFLQYLRILKQEQPDVILSYTIKPNVYCSLAATMQGLPIINNISGLGTVFIRKSWATMFVKALYRLALSRSSKVFFQNKDDMRLFLENNLVRAEITESIPGSGINLQDFSLLPFHKATQHRFRFLLIARMLWDKGIGEFVKAAKALHYKYPHTEFCLLGFLNVNNPSAIPRSQLEEWVSEGTIKYLGVVDDVRSELAAADCVVLPSYREGTPRALLEAAAIGKPIITTDVAGCREVVDDEQNGLLCKAYDDRDLAEKMEKILFLSDETRRAMGLIGRKKMERQFDEQIVIRSYLKAIEKIIYQKHRSSQAPTLLHKKKSATL